MKNTQHRTPLSNNSLIHRHHIHLESSDSETDSYNFSKLNVKQQWWKHASESVTPHPLACVPLQPLAKPPFFPSFHPATNTVTTQLTHKKRHPPHPIWKTRPVSFLPNQPKAQNTGSGYIQGSDECCCSQLAPSPIIPCTSSSTQTNRQTDHAPVCV